MRPPTEMPRRDQRPGSPNRGRVILVVAVAVLLFLVVSLRGIAGFYTDFLWFDSLGLTGVWTGVLGARIVLALIFIGLFFVLMWVNLLVADRLAPRFRPRGPEEEMLERYHDVVGQRAGLVRAGVAALFALIAGAGVASQWNSWILFTNRVDFGIEDPQFGTDIGFYVFQLPFLTFLTSWLFAAFVIILIVTAVAHYLNGGIRVQTQGERVTPQVKAHLSVLLGVLALVRAAGYWLDRYELTFSTRGAVDGATYPDVNAQLPAINLLLLISLFAAGLFLYNIRRRGWVLPVLAVGLWAFVAIVVGGIYPAFVQRFQVQPAESTREAPFIERNIEATRAAMNLDQVDTTIFPYAEDLSASDLQENVETIRNIRLLDPSIVNDTYQRLQAERGFYRFPGDLDVDRYMIDGRPTQVVLGARELNPGGIPQDSWEGEVLTYTHGFGVALSPANAVTGTGRPNFVVGDVPVRVDEGVDIDPEQPRIYFGENLGGYAVVNSDRAEVDFIDDAGNTVSYSYTGDGGVEMGSFFRQAAFALRFGDPNMLISNFLRSDSRVLYIRDIRDRVETVAPFIHFDADPYPVVGDGRVVYIVDGYTTTDRYPYAQRADTEQITGRSGLNHSFNYARNSVKAVVDAYDGSVTLYVIDPDDPIVQAYRKAFPDLFADFDDMPEELQDNIRYPEDLFTVQTNMWGRYHIEDPIEFYEQTNGWAVAQDPGSSVQGGGGTTAVTNAAGETTGTRERRVDPYYLLMRLPGQDDEEFVMLRTFVPVSERDERKELTSFMVARSDPENYGELLVYRLPTTQVDGPAIVAANIASEQDIAREISLLNQQGSTVLLGDLILTPIEDSLLYVRPLYVQASGQTAVPEMKNVIVAYGPEVVMRPTLELALTEIFGDSPDTLEDIDPIDPETGELIDPDLDPETGEVITDDDEADGDAGGDGDGTTTTTVPPTTTTPPTPGDETVDELLAQAAAALEEANEALASGDLGAYQDAVEEARRLILLAQSRSSGGSAATVPRDDSDTTVAPTTATTEST